MSDSLEALKRAIYALSVPSETQNANAWLVDFEKQVIAWEISLTLLSEPSQSPLRFYGAKFIYSKIKRNFFQLSHQDTVTSLMNNLNNYLLKLAHEKPLDMKVCRYICLALSALSLQINHPGIISSILNWLNPIVTTAPRIILQLLIVLPEECYNLQVDVNEDQRKQFSNQLCNSSSHVLDFLNFLWDLTDIEVKLQVLLCLENWIKFTNIDSKVLMQQIILQQVLVISIENELYLDACVDLVTTILTKYRSDHDIISMILQYTVSLKPTWNKKTSALDNIFDEDDLHICQCLCRLFSEVAETYITLFLSHDSSLEIYQKELMSQMIECAKFPHELSISRIPLKFFYEFSLVLSESGVPDSVKKYENAYLALLEICVQQLKIPSTILTGNQKMTDEVSDKRYEWSDTVADCCNVLGYQQCFERLFMLLVSLFDQIQRGENIWNDVESTLYSMQLICSKLPENEDKYIQQLCGFIVSLPDIKELRITVINLVGRIAHWLSNKPNLFNSFLASLMREIQNIAFSVVSARSIMAMLIHAAGKIEIPIDSLLNQVAQMRSNGSLIVLADLYLIEGVCVAMSRLSIDMLRPSFWRILEPVIISLDAITQQIDRSQSDHEGRQNLIVANIDRLTTAFRHVQMPGDVVVDIFVKVVPIVNRSIDVFPTDHMSEKICRFYKHSIRSCGMNLVNYMEPLINFFTSYFDKYSFSGFIYAGSILFSDYSKYHSGRYVKDLYKMVWSFSNSFFIKFPSVEFLTQAPDVVEEYFHFMTKVLKYAPDDFVNSKPEATAIVSAGINALSLQHREAQKGVLLFLETFIKLGSSDSPNKDVSSNLVKECAVHITLGLFSLLSAKWSAYAIDERDGCISDVLWNLKYLFPTYFKDWIAHGLSSLSPDATEEAIKMHFYEQIIAVQEKEQFSKLLDDLEFKCNRRK